MRGILQEWGGEKGVGGKKKERTVAICMISETSVT